MCSLFRNKFFEFNFFRQTSFKDIIEEDNNVEDELLEESPHERHIRQKRRATRAVR